MTPTASNVLGSLLGATSVLGSLLGSLRALNYTACAARFEFSGVRCGGGTPPPLVPRRRVRIRDVSVYGRWWFRLVSGIRGVRFLFVGVVSAALVLLALRALPCVALRCPALPCVALRCLACVRFVCSDRDDG